jgi:uncharacterized heparinase superfamily protein
LIGTGQSGKFATLLRYWHTLRHLRPVQFYGRLWFRAVKPRPNLDPPPPLSGIGPDWKNPAERRPSLLGPRQFLFLNVAGSLDELAWDGAEPDKLWRYNQHYFDDLTAHESASRRGWHRSLIEDWIAGNPPGLGTGWEPYPLSLRIINWIKWSLAGNDATPSASASLAVQARWLEKRIEWHLLGNHLLINAKALLFAGHYFCGIEARRWRERAVRILLEQLPQQILDDGAQFELSPMYHLLACEDVLDIINLLHAQSADLTAKESELELLCRSLLPDMLGWASAMLHPDGKVAQFNDCAFDVGPDFKAIKAYAGRLGFATDAQSPDSLLLPASGYARMTKGDMIVIVDVAPVGADYLPGHAHADTLSFEVSLGSQRVFVNGGTSVYGTGPERVRQRGSEAHNTVVVDGRNSSDVWSGFRVGRRARIIDRTFLLSNDNCRVSGAHDGYRFLSSRAIVRREWIITDGQLVINDYLDDASLPANAYFHLHPDIDVTLDNPLSGTLALPDGRICRWESKTAAAVRPSLWNPEFGKSHPASQLVFPLAGGHASLTLSW